MERSEYERNQFRYKYYRFVKFIFNYTTGLNNIATKEILKRASTGSTNGCGRVEGLLDSIVSQQRALFWVTLTNSTK